MTMSHIMCGACHAQLTPTNTRNALHLCPVCDSPFEMAVFPAFTHTAAIGQTGEPTVEDTESACFYHSQKRAVAACDNCGRFLCALCDVDLHGRHLCPPCIEAGITNRAMANLEFRRVRYDGIALTLALLPVPLIWPTLLSAPATLFIALRYWNAPPSIMGKWRTRVRMSLALIIASLQLVFWVLMFGGLILSGVYGYTVSW